jgi:leucyl aminopeptidase
LPSRASRRSQLWTPADQLDKAVKVAGFSGKLCSTADVIAPVDAAADRIALVGAGEPGKLSAHEWMRIGGKVFTQIRKTEKVTILLGDADAVSAEAAADMALGLLMRAYSFDLYKTKKKDDGPRPGQRAGQCARPGRVCRPRQGA